MPLNHHEAADLSGASQGADGRHDVNWLDSPGLPLLVQDVSSLHDFLTVGVEHALEELRDVKINRRTATQHCKASLPPCDYSR